MMNTMSRTVGINVVAQATQGKQTQKARLSAPKASFVKGAALRVRAASTATVSREALSVRAEDMPTVADTKAKFIQAYNKPIPAVYNTVLQEMIVLQHMSRYQKNYKYSAVQALGFTSVFDQIFETYKYGAVEEIFSAYINALNEDPVTYRADTNKLLDASPSASSVADLAEMEDIKGMAALAAEGKLMHNRFQAIGLFRMLELAGLTDPSALSELVTASGMKQDMVNRDLMTYKGLLSKLSAAKELQKEFNEREKKKTAERLAQKEAKEAAEANTEA